VRIIPSSTILHHSELLLELIQSGRLVPKKRWAIASPITIPAYSAATTGSTTRRDACSRWLGLELVEMPRNRDNSFCCGAGGGRIWMKELGSEGARRPSAQRIDEAIALGGLEYVVVACPKDVTTYEDAIKTSGHQGEIQLRAISERVLEALDPAREGAATAGSAEEAR
jgi:Fe-S oxidoreductase